MINNRTYCDFCREERRKADRSRKYAHELKNIFITISTIVNTEIEAPTINFSNISGNTSHIADSGDVSPFIMEGRRHRVSAKVNNNNNNNTDSPFYFLKTLCEYGNTLVKEINELGKDFVDNNGEIKPFNISKAIDFCVDVFETKRKYDKEKRNLQIYSDINFSYDKEIKSINEIGFKIVLINLLTNAYKFTTKGKIIVRAVSIPKEKKIRILLKDSGKGFNPNKFIQNGCFFVIKENQELNKDGSGLGLTIVNEILTKFNIKLYCISSTEKGGTLFYFDLDDSYPYYDEINPQNLMTDSLSQMINDINSGKKDNELSLNSSPKNHQRFFKENFINNINNKKVEAEKKSTSNNNNNNSNLKTSNKNLNLSNSNKINVNNNSNHRFSFMDSGEGNINCSPTFNNNSTNNSNNTNSNININVHKTSEKKVSLKNLNNTLEKNPKNLNVNIYNLNNATLVSFDGNKIKKGTVNNNDNNLSNVNNTIIITNKKKIDRFFSLPRRDLSNLNKKEVKTSMLKKVIERNHKYKKMRTFNLSEKKGKDIQVDRDQPKKSIDYAFNNNLIEKEDESEIIDLKAVKEEVKIMNEEKKNQKKDYKKLLDKNFNKTNFYLFELKKIFRKNEIYIHLSLRKNKRCTTEPPSERATDKKLKTKKSFVNNNNNNKVYIIICDDEEFVARSARELIINYYTKKGKDPHVYFTPNGIECLYLMYKLTIIQNRKIEYILMDLEMPYLNGIKTCNIIKSIHETNVPVYILSGDEPNDCSANGYCNKPLSEIDIINKLDKDNKCK